MITGDDHYNRVAVAIAIVVVAVYTVATAISAAVAVRTDKTKEILSQHSPVQARARGGSEVRVDVEVVYVRAAK